MPMPKDERRLAVVPAYNEAATVGDVVGALHRDAPGWDVLVIDDGSTDDTAAVAAGGGRARRSGCRSTSASAAPCRPASVTRASTATTSWSRSTATASTTRPRSRACSRPCATTRRSTWCAARASSREDQATPRRSAAAPASTSSRSCSRASCGQRVSDPTSGFRLYNRRAIGLFARDYPHDYPEVEAVLMLHHHRLRMREVPGADVRSAAAACPRSARASPRTT